MPKESIVTGLDIGTTKISVCTGKISEGLITVIGATRVPNAGVRKGVIVDIEDTVSAISSALEEVEKMAGIPINSVITSVGGTHISSTNSRGVVAVSRSDGEITQNDLDRALEAAKTVALPPNQEILHVIPQYYIIDGQESVLDPLGMSGIRLEVSAMVIGASSVSIKNLTKCINQAGLNLEEIVFAPLASGKFLLNKRQKELGVMLVDIGGGTTSMAIFESGDILHSCVIPVGSMHITNDIAIGLRTSLETAEKIKTHYGSAMPAKIRESESINLSNIDPQDHQKIERKYVAEIIHARLLEIFSLLHEELRKVGKDGMLPAGIIFTGGGSKIEDLVELAKEELRLPAQIACPTFQVSGLVDKIETQVYSTSIGLMLHGLESNQNSGQFNLNLMNGNVLDKAKSFFKQFIP